MMLLLDVIVASAIAPKTKRFSKAYRLRRYYKLPHDTAKQP